MRKSFNFPSLAGIGRGPQFWLLIVAGLLLILNAGALFLYLAPPGGSDSELQQERNQLENQISGARMRANRLRDVASKVELGAQQAGTFERQYFLPERVAYEAVISEIQRMAKASGLEEGQAAFSSEPIEGSDDLSVLNTGARFQGSYGNFLRFLHEADVSPMLLMLDTVQATPQQHSGQIETEIRFQAIVSDTALPSTQSAGTQAVNGHQQ